MNADEEDFEFIAEAVGEAIGEAFELTHASPVAGGCIHTALRIDGETRAGKSSFFAKLNDAEKKALFAAEADGLGGSAKVGAVRVPKVIAQGDDGERAWLVLEWLDLAALGARSGAKLGEQLATQHRAAQEKFGWPRDNFIGSSPQVNGQTDDWLAFWREKRLLPQLRFAAHHR